MPTPSRTGEHWSEHEVRLIVSDYFEMLEAEIFNQPYVKADHYRALLPRLDGRTKQAIEFKHANISAVLREQHLPFIDGYKPRGNYQVSLLPRIVEEHLDAHADLLSRLEEAESLNPTAKQEIPRLNVQSIYEAPPDDTTIQQTTSKPWLSRKGARTDFVQRDAQNRALGRLGEAFVYDLERFRLYEAGRDDLAQRVEWVSQEIGDGLGFDIISFNAADGAERKLEVKTTGHGKHFPFYLTTTEIRCSQDVPSQFELCRVFDFSRQPRIYTLHGSLSESCHLDPVLFRALP